MLDGKAGTILNRMDWYALFVETGKEDLVRTMINKYIVGVVVHAIVPKIKIIERRQGENYEVCKTMFPGYVFVNTQMSVKTYYELKQIPGYYQLLNKYKKDNKQNKKLREIDLGNDKENALEPYLFSKIDDDEMDQILQLIGNDEVIDFSTLYLESAKVTVCDGPLKGKQGIIKKVDKRKKRARIVLKFMGDEKWFDIGIEMLTPPGNNSTFVN